MAGGGRCEGVTARKPKEVITVAVTGRAGSGKSLVCRIFGQLGAKVLDLDKLAREAVLPGGEPYARIVACFGEAVVDSSGGLDRKALRREITKDREAKRKLEEITHPEIFRLLERHLDMVADQTPDAVVVVEVPLLVETGAQGRFDVVVLVEADEDNQVQRIVERDGCSRQEAKDLLAVQASSRESIQHADYLIRNTGSIQVLEGAVKDIYAQVFRKDLKGLDTRENLS